jgi:hypothetical protein
MEKFIYKTKPELRVTSYESLHERGVAALLTIVIVAAATLIMAYSASLLGLGELELGYTSQKGEEAFSIADGCMEEAMRRIRVNTSYTGDSLNVSNGSCTITVTGSGPYTLGVIASTTESHYKKLEASVSIASRVITVNSWEEKDD